MVKYQKEKSIEKKETCKINIDNKQNFQRTTKSAKKKHEKTNKGEIPDPKRNFSEKQKNIIWYNSDTHDSFDSEVFKLDMLGCLVISRHVIGRPRGEYYKSKLFWDAEHIVSHSNNGKTTPGNGSVLNAGINRSKGRKQIWDIEYYECKGLKSEFGVDPEDLLIELKYELHETCSKYNLLFIKDHNNRWTLDKNKTKSEQFYSGEYLPCVSDSETVVQEEIPKKKRTYKKRTPKNNENSENKPKNKKQGSVSNNNKRSYNKNKSSQNDSNSNSQKNDAGSSFNLFSFIGSLF